MYSLIRVWIGSKLARMLIQVSVVVRTTRATDRPSTPSLYWMPKTGIQTSGLHELEAGPSGQEADEQQQRHDAGQDRRAKRERPGRAQARRRNAMSERPDERHEDDDASGSGCC